jgi:hypothetical protein
VHHGRADDVALELVPLLGTRAKLRLPGGEQDRGDRDEEQQ